jgi:ferredoxin
VDEKGRAVVDREKCYSYGRCVDMLPDVFHLDADGISVVSAGSHGSLVLLIEAAEDCPVRAISVIGPDGTIVFR